MKKLFSVLMSVIFVMLCMAFVFICQAADTAAAAETSQSLVEFFSTNAVIILGAALAVSEVLALIPALKGNGILDSIIKGLQTLIALKKG